MAEASLSVSIPLGIDGLFGSKNPAHLPPSSLTVADNLTYIDGTLKKEGGAAKYNLAAVAGAVLAGTDWWPTTTVQRSVILTATGRILKDTGGGTYPLELKSGLTARAPYGSFIAGGKEAAANPRKLFCFTGTDPVQVLAGDGLTTAPIATPPADWSDINQPCGGFIHLSRLWAFGNLNDPHRLYYSTTENHEAPTNTLAIYSGDGERIMAAISLRGFIIVFKYPNGIFYVDSRDPSATNWRVDKITDEVGICGVGGATLAEKTIYFLDSGGNLQVLDQINQDAFGVTNLGNIAHIKSFINTNFNLGALETVKSVFYPKEREIHFAVPHIGSEHPNRRFVVDLNRETPRFRYSSRDGALSLWTRKIHNLPRLAMGDVEGFVWDLDTEARNKDGLGYPLRFETAPTDLGFADPELARKRKNGRFLEIIYEPTGAHVLSLDLLWDGVLEDRYAFDLGASLGGFILGSSKLGEGRLGGGSILSSVRKRITGSGKRVSFRGSNGGVNENLSLSTIILYFAPSDERANV